VSRLTIRAAEELQAQTREALEPVIAAGRIADVYLQFANSESALRAYLHMESSIREGSLSNMEAEAIKLWVSQQLFEEARGAGLNDETLVDLTMAISTIFFTNITNHINDSQSQLPAAPALD